MQAAEYFQPELTADGTFTFFSSEFGEAFHSRQGARQEAQGKFVQPTCIAQKAESSVIRVLDVCYGLGYNTAEALATIWAVHPHCRVEWIGLELNISVPQAAIAHSLLAGWPEPIPQILTQMGTTCRVETAVFQGHLLVGDGRQQIQRVYESGFQADAIFLDPFSPPHCPQLWTVEFLAWVARCLHPKGYLATYSCAAAVRTALVLAGLKIASTPGVGRLAPGTVARWDGTDLPPLSEQEREHLVTRAAIPYRDPSLTDQGDMIQARRHQEQLLCSLEPTTHWRKRWALGHTRPTA